MVAVEVVVKAGLDLVEGCFFGGIFDWFEGWWKLRNLDARIGEEDKDDKESESESESGGGLLRGGGDGDGEREGEGEACLG